MASELPRSLDTASKLALFSVSDLKDENLIKKQTYMETETSNSILESFECYTVSKLVRFLRHSVDSLGVNYKRLTR